jgi:hypothetical protein
VVAAPSAPAAVAPVASAPVTVPAAAPQAPMAPAAEVAPQVAPVAPAAPAPVAPAPPAPVGCPIPAGATVLVVKPDGVSFRGVLTEDFPALGKVAVDVLEVKAQWPNDPIAVGSSRAALYAELTPETPPAPAAPAPQAPVQAAPAPVQAAPVAAAPQAPAQPATAPADVAPAPRTRKPRTQDPNKVNKGVRESRTRPYIAGEILKEFGLDNGITPAMVAALEARYPKPNVRESEFALRNAWHAVRGFLGLAITEANTAVPAANPTGLQPVPATPTAPAAAATAPAATTPAA